MRPAEIDSLGLFHLLSPAGRELLRQGVQYAECNPGSPILHPGQSVSGAYFVLCGRLRVYTMAPDGTAATLYFIDPGETCVFALNSLFNDLRYPAWVAAEKATRVALIPGPTYRRLFQGEPGVQDATVSALSTLVFRLMGALEEVHACHLDQRLSNFLLTHANGEGEIRITQQQLADHLGTTREVIARLMQGLVAKKLVVSGRGRIRLLDSNSLASPGHKSLI